MEIFKKYKNADTLTTEQNNVIWELYSKKYKIFLISFFALGFVSLIIGIVDFDGYVTVIKLKEVTKYNFHLFFILGIIFLLISTFFFIFFTRTKKFFFKTAHENSLRHLQGNNEISLKITDEYIQYESSFLTQKTNWVLIKKFKFVKDFIFLYTANADLFFIIDRRTINKSEFDFIVNLLTRNKVKAD